jgi:AcrR family transcriptional regulator
MTEKRLTQTQRRTHTQSAVLASACRLFGRQGYTATSLEDIAHDCGLTIRPIYHYFGNKKALFAAVNEQAEQRILDIVTSEPGNKGASRAWSRFLQLCEDPCFRQTVLIDSPNILGRERWQSSPVVQTLMRQIVKRNCDGMEPADLGTLFRLELQARMTISALAEAALMIAEAPDAAMAKREAHYVVLRLLSLYNEPGVEPDD